MKRVLIADDSPDFLQALRRALEQNDWKVDDARDGAEAFARAKRLQPAIIVSGIRMPVMDGRGLLHHCRVDETLRAVPFVMISDAPEENERSLLDLGADAVLAGNRQAEELVVQIEETFRRVKSQPSKPATVTAITSNEARPATESGSWRVLEASGVGAVHWNLVTGELAWPDSKLELLETKRGEFDRRYATFRRLVHPDDLPGFEAKLASARERREVFRQEFRIRRTDRGLRWLAMAGEFIYDADGVARGMTGIVQNLTAARSLELALREAVEFNRQMISSAQEGIVVFDRQNRYLVFNSFMERLRGVRVIDVLGKTPRDVLPEPYASETEERNQRALAGETVIVPEMMAPPSTRGETIWLSLIASPLRDTAGRIVGVIAVLRDVTALKRAHDAVRENEERLRQVTENIGEVFWLSDVSKETVIYISPAYEKIWGRSCASLLEDPESWLEAVHPDDRERVRTAAHTQQESGDYNQEYRVIRPDRSLRWVHDRAFPIRDANGRVYRIAGVAEDITSARSLEERYRQAQKMEAVGQLAGGIAHDFNNLLTVIQMQGSLLQNHADTFVVECVQPLLEAAERAANLTWQLLTFSRRQVKESRHIDLKSVISTTVSLLRRVMREDIALETQVTPDVPLVNADAGMIEQVLMNLAVNARDAMPTGGRLVIALDAVTIDENYVALHAHSVPGEFVRLTVRDTGTGISEEHLPHIFEPFYTTKEVGKGTGLGLATVFGIVEQHGGWIEVESALGKGTSFHVFLPALPSGAKVEQVAAPQLPAAQGGQETILLVEDEAQVRFVACKVLQRLGYRVIEAATANEAIELCQKRETPVDLLVTDLIMPGGTGHQLAESLRQSWPELRVIYMSGYSDEIVNRTLQVEPGADFLSKPFEAEALASIVRRALDQPRSVER